MKSSQSLEETKDETESMVGNFESVLETNLVVKILDTLLENHTMDSTDSKAKTQFLCQYLEQSTYADEFESVSVSDTTDKQMINLSPNTSTTDINVNFNNVSQKTLQLKQLSPIKEMRQMH